MRFRVLVIVLLTTFAVTMVKAVAQDEAGGGAAEMARKLQDPLANIAAIMTDNDILFGTSDDDTSYSFKLQPVYAIGFYVAYNGTISADWTRSSDDTWTVPLGGIAGKTIDMGGRLRPGPQPWTLLECGKT